MFRDLFANAQPVRPHRFTWRFEKSKGRLHVWGSEFGLDIAGVRGLIQQGIISGDLEAVIHTAPRGTMSILRAHWLIELGLVRE